MYKKSKLALAVGAALLITGCGGGGSESSSSETPSKTDTVTISGRAADGYLMNATVCADLNSSGTCDAGEPSDTTRAGGAFTLELTPLQTAANIVVEAIANLTVDEDTGQPIPAGFTLRAPINTDKEQQFISPVTTMVNNEMTKGGGKTLDQAKEAVAQRLQTSFDVMGDYVAAATNDTDPSSQQSAARLHRIAQVTARVAAQIEGAVDQSVLDQLDMTMKEYLDLVSAQVETLLAAILTGIDAGLSNPDFNPDDILGDIELEDPTTPPVAPPTTTDALADRMSEASPANPFYRQTPSGIQPIIDEPIITLEFQEHSTLPGRYYYLGLESSVLFGDPGGDTISTNEIAPKLADGGQHPTYPDIIPAENIHVLLWAGGAQQFETIEKQMIGTQVATPTPYGYTTSAYNDSILTTADYTAIDLSDLNIKATIPALFPTFPSNDLVDVPPTSSFSLGSTAYSRSEKLKDDLFITSWHRPWEPGESACGSGPLVTEVLSCNLLYGNISRAPAKTFDQLTYPNDGHSIYGNWIGFTDNGTQYEMYLIGSKSDGSGQIRVFEKGSSFELSSAAIGSWSLQQEPFEHYTLTMPDGIHYKAFMSKFGIGSPFLHEHEGYLRAGWHVPAGAELEAIFNRAPDALALNEEARNNVLQALNDASLLVQHEGFEQD